MPYRIQENFSPSTQSTIFQYKSGSIPSDNVNPSSNAMQNIPSKQLGETASVQQQDSNNTKSTIQQCYSGDKWHPFFDTEHGKGLPPKLPDCPKIGKW